MYMQVDRMTVMALLMHRPHVMTTVCGEPPFLIQRTHLGVAMLRCIVAFSSLFLNIKVVPHNML